MATDSPQAFASFREFYPFYLGEHRNRISRRLHVVGTFLMLTVSAVLVATGHWVWLPVALAGNYAFAWVGHFGFEKNKPATFRWPFYSLLGDLVMFRDVLLRRIPW
jgi:hypothetical protein